MDTPNPDALMNDFLSRTVQTRLGSISFRERPGTGIALVMLHGIGGNSGGWSKQRQAFGTTRMILWDAPGYGDSSCLAADCPGVEGYAAAFIAFLDALEIGQAIVLGHSFGGLIAACAAALSPERFSRLLLTACSSGHATYEAEERESVLRARLAAFAGGDATAYARMRVANVLSETPDPAVFEEAVRVMSRIKLPGFHQATRMVSTADVFGYLPAITAPTRVICGTADRVTPLELNRKIAAAIRGADLVPIDKAGHWVFLEYPREFNAAVEEFIRPAQATQFPQERNHGGR